MYQQQHIFKVPEMFEGLLAFRKYKDKKKKSW